MHPPDVGAATHALRGDVSDRDGVSRGLRTNG